VIDSHCHLAGEEFAADLPDVVSRARGAGLTTAVCILAAGNDAESARAAMVRHEWPAIRFAAGIHPHQAGHFAGAIDGAAETVRRSVAYEDPCAIGEIGLDYHYDFSPRDVQQEIFGAQVRLAREFALPIVIHTREATEDTFRILREAGEGHVRGVFHCFTGDEAMARAALDIGFYLSFAGIVTFPGAGSIRDAAKIVPDDRLLAETDAPYLAPVPYRGKRNEPAHVVQVIQTLAQVRGVRPEQVAARVTRNFEVLFGAPPARGSRLQGE
jgi:TatD DNase family protein